MISIMIVFLVILSLGLLYCLIFYLLNIQKNANYLGFCATFGVGILASTIQITLYMRGLRQEEEEKYKRTEEIYDQCYKVLSKYEATIPMFLDEANENITVNLKYKNSNENMSMNLLTYFLCKDTISFDDPFINLSKLLVTYNSHIAFSIIEHNLIADENNLADVYFLTNKQNDNLSFQMLLQRALDIFNEIKRIIILLIERISENELSEIYVDKYIKDYLSKWLSHMAIYLMLDAKNNGDNKRNREVFNYVSKYVK